MPRPTSSSRASDDRATGPRGGPARGEGRKQPARVARDLTVALALTALVLAAYVAVASRDQSDAAAALAAARLDLATLPADLPLRAVGGAFLVEAVIGEAPGRAHGERAALILDTGAPTTLLPGLVDRVGGVPVGTLEEVTPLGERVARDVVPVGRVALGGAIIDDVAAVRGVLAPDHPLRCVTDAGWLGADVMADGAWQLDPGSGRLAIASSTEGLGRIDGSVRLPFTASSASSPTPVIELGLAAGSLRVVVDTGSDGWLTVHPDDLVAAGGTLPSGTPVRWATISTSEGPTLAAIRPGRADVRLGEARIAGMPIATTDALAPGLGVLGTDFLRQVVLTIDWPRRVLHLEPLDEAGIGALRPAAPSLATVGWSGDGLAIRSFVEGPQASAAGLAVGLPVLAIDGRSVAGADRREACDLGTLGSPSTFDLTVLGGRTLHVAPVDDFFEQGRAAGG